MKVIAIERGYDGLTIREPGDEFELPEFSGVDKDGQPNRTRGTWFKSADEDTKGPVKAKKGKQEEIA